MNQQGHQNGNTTDASAKFIQTHNVLVNIIWHACVCGCCTRLTPICADRVSSGNASHKEHKIFIYDALIIINHVCELVLVAFCWN